MDVLVADDDPVSRRLIAAFLIRLGHQPVEAEDGEQAWERFLERRIRLVISDWQMPGLDGLELLRQIRQADGDSRYTWFILLTAHHAAEQVEQAIAAGVDDHLSKPVARLELVSRLASAGRILALQQDLAERNLLLSDANARYQRDLLAAAAAARALLPQEPLGVPGWDLAWRSDPCEELGGDLLGFRRCPDGRLAAWLFDVSGHGVAAALLAVQVDRILGPLLAAGTTAPEDVALALARTFHLPKAMRYLTLVYLLLDPADGRVRLLSAAHPSPILVRRAGRVERMEIRAHPIGLLPAAHCQFHTWEWTMEPGDRLLLVSDGVLEENAPSGQPFGHEHLASATLGLAGLAPAATCDALFARLADWRGQAPPADDVTLLLIERTGTGDPGAAAHDPGI